MIKKIILWSIILSVCALNIYPALLEDARKDYLNGYYEEAISKAKSVEKSSESLYFLGLVYMKMANYPQAREYFLEAMQSSQVSKMQEKAYSKLADCYFLEGDFLKAKELYQEIERKYPSTGYKPLLYLRLAQIASKEGKWDDKKKYIDLLKEKYPYSSEVALADVIEARDDFFTIQVGAFSSRKNALSLRDDLSDKYDSYVIEDKSSNYTLYKVRVGKFKDRETAERTWKKLIKQGYPARIYP